ncbi:APC family permease [uncultured Chryseobacterium sp.]|uniref:APC family permease n=1 Tax=uncultured Chryseobacterium sp. TaxID=259322 RepID=UPI0025EDA079|nr:APC family permease [uncultured Chryseobacterium sp.]
MELRIKPFPKNSYPKKGLLIKGSSPLVWLHEMEMLGINLNEVLSFPVPASEPNVLYGCFLVFEDLAPNDIGRNAYFQCVDDYLFIPENTTFYPKINPEDWQQANATFLIMHPVFGLVELNEEIDWLSLIQNPKPSEDKVRKPSNGVRNPQKIERFTVEMDDEKVLEALEKPQTEEEWMKHLPFDMKKVMAGNKKEIEKYLKYIEKYPDRAVELGVPLDIMGTSRGDGFGIFRFKIPWLEKIFGKKEDDVSGEKSSGKSYAWVFWVVLLMIGLARVFMTFNQNQSKESQPVSSGKVQAPDKIMTAPVVAYKSGVTDIDMKIDSLYGKKRRELMKEHMKASLSMSRPDEKSYREYLENGGRPIDKIQNDVFKLNDKTDAATDSLKRVYRKKIVKYLAQNEGKIRKKIADSIRKTGSGKPADEGLVKTIMNKKAVLIEDSLGRLYGTKEYPQTPPPVAPLDNGSHKAEEKSTSFSEIFWLIVAMTGAVGLYSFFVKRKSLNVGGENIPGGTKIFLMILLVVMLAYIFYPLIGMFGYNWFVWLLIIGIVLLLYRLFSEDKTILKSDKDE